MIVMPRQQLALMAVGALLAAGCSAARHDAGMAAPATVATASVSVTAPPAATGANQVAIDDFAFAPATLTVHAGTTVTWTNRDEEPHTVAASDGSFHSPGMGTGATFSHIFAAAGTFDYVCSIHPMMHGTVVVTP
jgi:plastocyanin